MTMTHRDGRPMFHPQSQSEWRAWLADHHAVEQSVWMIHWKKASGKQVFSYEEAVEEALCFGWIDSTTSSLDQDRTLYYFARRNPKSPWARSNKERVERLIADGRMTDAGMALIETAKENGYWSIYDDIENLVVPDDLAGALDAEGDARRYFDAFTVSARKNILWWIKSAKRPATRARRIAATASLAAENRMANHPKGQDQGPAPDASSDEG